MDWEAVAGLLARQVEPVVVVDCHLRIQMLDERLAQVLGVRAEDVVRSHLSDLCESRRLPEIARDALGGKQAVGKSSVVTQSGARVELVLEAVRVGTDDHSDVLLYVRSAFEHAREAPAPAGATPVEYEIAATIAPFGRLLRLVTDQGVHHYWSEDAPRCHEAIHGSSRPCADCPALRAADGAVAVRGPKCSGDGHEVVQLVGGGPRLRLVVVRLEESAVVAIALSRLRALMDSVRLSASERAVIEHLMRGSTPAMITTALGISLPRLREVLSSIVRKSSIGSRADLLRSVL